MRCERQVYRETTAGPQAAEREVGLERQADALERERIPGDRAGLERDPQARDLKFLCSAVERAAAEDRPCVRRDVQSLHDAASDHR